MAACSGSSLLFQPSIRLCCGASHPYCRSSFNRLAVDFDGDGRKDIWDDRADALGSIANYLARSGWEGGVLWGREVTLPAGLNRGDLGRENRKPLGEWARLGVRKADGSALPSFDQDAAIVVPGDDGQAFAVYRNFNAIRRYNPSDFYALAVGMLFVGILGISPGV